MSYTRLECTNCDASRIIQSYDCSIAAGDTHCCFGEKELGNWYESKAINYDPKKWVVECIENITKVIELEVLSNAIKLSESKRAELFNLYNKLNKENNYQNNISYVEKESNTLEVLLCLSQINCLLDVEEIKSSIRFYYKRKYDCLDPKISITEITNLFEKERYFNEWMIRLKYGENNE